MPESLAGKRLDQILAELFPDYSRSRMKKWITEGKVSVDAQVIEKPREKLEFGALVAIDAELEREERYQAQPIELDIVYEDELCVAFRDIAPVAPVHILIIPRKPIVSIATAEPGDKAILGHLLLTAGAIAADLGLAENGYRLVTNINNDGF